MPKKSSKNAAKKSAGLGHDGRDPSSPTPSPSDGDAADSNDSWTSSETPSQSTSTQPSKAKKKRAKKTQFCLDVQEEQLMRDFLLENAILWDIKKTDYWRVDKRAKLWEDQAKAMGKTFEHLEGCFKPLRDTHNRLDKKKSGDSSPELTERDQWVKANFSFIKTLVSHHEPVNSWDLEASETASADMVVDDHTPSTVLSLCSQRLGKRSQDDDHLLQSLQERVPESGELIKGLAQPQPITVTTAFANYVLESLVIMSKLKFRKARSRINTILSEVTGEESDEEEPHRVPIFPAPAYVRLSSASATYTPTALEIYQPPPLVWRHKTPAATVWGSQIADYVDQYMQQPLQPQYQQQQPQNQRMMLFPPQPPPQITQQPRSASAPATIGSAHQVLNQSPSSLDANSQSMSNISGLSGMLNLTSSFDAVSSPSEEMKTFPALEKN